MPRPASPQVQARPHPPTSLPGHATFSIRLGTYSWKDKQLSLSLRAVSPPPLHYTPISSSSSAAAPLPPPPSPPPSPPFPPRILPFLPAQVLGCKPRVLVSHRRRPRLDTPLDSRLKHAGSHENKFSLKKFH